MKLFDGFKTGTSRSFLVAFLFMKSYVYANLAKKTQTVAEFIVMTGV
jgi:hypothetical protein